MSTAPLPPISPMGPGSEPDNTPDLVDPDTETAEPEEDPNEQLPHWDALGD